MEKRLDGQRYSDFRRAILDKKCFGKSPHFEREEKKYLLAKKVINEHREELIDEPFERLTATFITGKYSKDVEIPVSMPKNLTDEETEALIYSGQLKMMFLIKLLGEMYSTAFRFEIASSNFDCNGKATVFLYRFHMSDYLF